MKNRKIGEKMDKLKAALSELEPREGLERFVEGGHPSVTFCVFACK